MLEVLKYFAIPCIISILLYWPVKIIAKRFNLYAKVNERTIHHGQIPRIGGIMIYISFIIFSLICIRQTNAFDGLLVGGTIIFVEGLLDDIFDIKPVYKILGQLLAATVLIYLGGVYLPNIHLFFGVQIKFKLVSYLVTYLWIIGITNAVNLIDGLDGLAAGFSIIVLLTIAILSGYAEGTIMPVCVILAGATFGFLVFNFNPAKIFMGDCGAQLLGFLISAISLYGFRSTTFITLGLPIILLFIPIADTLLAIVRRRLKGQSIATADKNHLHHVLMNNLKLGQKGAVIVIYVVTILFGINAYFFLIDKTVGSIMLVMMILIFEVFIEYTGMISTKFRPILNLIDKLKKMK